MAIKDKDGNVYTLRHPNPIMKTQKQWDLDKISLFNFNFCNKTVIQDQEKLETESFFEKTPAVKEKFITSDDFLNALSNSRPKETEDPPVELNTNNKKVARILRERGTIFHCLPVIEREIEDSLYEEVLKTSNFDKKMIFEGVILDSNDLQLELWCLLNLSKGSIIYPKARQGGERWWKVLSSTTMDEGYTILCVISEINPDFT